MCSCLWANPGSALQWITAQWALGTFMNASTEGFKDDAQKGFRHGSTLKGQFGVSKKM